jgi:phosphoserine phosphatase
MSSREIEGNGQDISPRKEGRTSFFRIAIFDLDGTLTDLGKYSNSNKIGLTWPKLFQVVGNQSEHVRLRNKYGEHSNYMEWSAEACQSLKELGLTEDEFLKVMGQQIIRKEAKELIAQLHKRHFITAIITGGFRALAERAQRELGIDYVVAHCDLLFGDNGRLEDWHLENCDSKGKAVFLENIAKKFGHHRLQCIFVGNGKNDIYAFQRAGLSIAYKCADKKVGEFADVWIKEGNLLSILDHISIASADERKIADIRKTIKREQILIQGS